MDSAVLLPLPPHNDMTDDRSVESSPALSSGDETYISCSRTLSLVVDSANVNPASPLKKRRVSTSAAGWQDFCRKGTRFKTLLDDALEKVTSSTIGVDNTSNINSNSNSNSNFSIDNSTAASSSVSSVATLARQKTTECIQLQQKLEQIKSEQAQTKALSHELQEAAKQQASRMHKMTTALNLATQNATKARTEADEAEAEATTLETQLEALQVVVQETKRASQLLLHEQEDVTQKANYVEQKYVQAQAELNRSNAAKLKMHRNNEQLSKTNQMLENHVLDLKTTAEHERGEAKRWKLSCAELEAMGETQQNRIRTLEQDVHQANNLLVEATSTAAETESTSIQLKNSLEKMQQTIESLHKQLENKQKDERKEKEKDEQQLSRVLHEAQALKAQVATQQDQIKQMSFERQSQEKRFTQLQTKTSNLERRLQDSTTNIVTSIASSTSTNDFSIPPLNGKENPVRITKCVICFKSLTTGLMKRCQCGNPSCTMRAHISCVSKVTTGPSLSHPGTPAPPLPVILCSAAKSNICSVAKSNLCSVAKSNPSSTTKSN